MANYLLWLIVSLQIWRLVTSLLWHPVNFNWLMMLFFLYSYSRLLEEGVLINLINGIMGVALT